MKALDYSLPICPRRSYTGSEELAGYHPRTPVIRAHCQTIWQLRQILYSSPAQLDAGGIEPRTEAPDSSTMDMMRCTKWW